MKRSEMLSKIASVIINYNQAHCVINREKAMEMAETILQIQKEVGMLPPRIQRRDGVTQWCGISVIEDWEPEE